MLRNIQIMLNRFRAIRMRQREAKRIEWVLNPLSVLIFWTHTWTWQGCAKWMWYDDNGSQSWECLEDRFLGLS